MGETDEPIILGAYERLAKTIFESVEKRDIFAHLLLFLDWRLVKRAENCVNAKINHIHFHSDCLIFDFAKSKGHKKENIFDVLGMVMQIHKNVVVSSAIIIAVFVLLS